MTLTADIASVVAPNSVTWSMVDTGFYVASRAGEFVGSVDATADGHFVSFDSTSAPIARYGSLAEAKSAVLDWKPVEKLEDERRLSRVLMPVATAAGLVAGAVAFTGALLNASVI